MRPAFGLSTQPKTEVEAGVGAETDTDGVLRQKNKSTLLEVKAKNSIELNFGLAPTELNSTELNTSLSFIVAAVAAAAHCRYSRGLKILISDSNWLPLSGAHPPLLLVGS